jgi:hypothetical protein
MTNQRNNGDYGHLDAPTHIRFALDVRKQKMNPRHILRNRGKAQTELHSSALAAGVPKSQIFGRGYTSASVVEENMQTLWNSRGYPDAPANKRGRR